MKKFRLKKIYIVILLVFLIINTVCLFYRSGALSLPFYLDIYVVVVANLLLFLLALLGAYRHQKALQDKNPNIFIRSIMLMTVLKFFILVAAALIYVFLAKENRNVPAIIASMILYVIYAVIEASTAYKLNKAKNG